jgi:hypothetical protein
MQGSWVCGALWTLGVLVGGCSADSKERTPLSRDEFISSVCAEYAPCCSEAGLPADAEECRGYYDLVLPAGGFDGGAARACLDGYRKLQDKCTGTLATPACDRVFNDGSGTQQPGESCETTRDCALPDDGIPLCAPDRKCQVLREGIGGSSPCLATRDGGQWIFEGDFSPSGYYCDVAAGLFCDGSSLACRPLFKVGEECYPNTVGCVESAFCDVRESKCRLRDATGESCELATCAAGNFCDETQKCAPLLRGGASCTADMECVSAFCKGGTCDGDEPYACGGR